MKPAPVQLAYRSHPGSLGADWMDYSLSDTISNPPSAAHLQPEKAAMMPLTGHANDYWQLRREHDLAPMRMSDRDDYGVPEDRVVLQNLGLYSRVDPVTWTSWANMLARLPNASMWLLRATNEGERRLERELLAHGIDIEENRDRVRFSDPVGREEHVRRSALGDIHLDTPAHSGHTMALETLWSGTPVATVPLEASTSRTAACAWKAAMSGTPTLWSDRIHGMVSQTRKEQEDLVVELSMKTPRAVPRAAPRARMFDLKDWTSGGLNVLMQRHATKGRVLRHRA